MPYRKVKIDGTSYEIAHAIVRTKVCPVDVRLVIIRSKVKKSKPYRYFWVYTSDLTLSIERIVLYYRQRWSIETAFRDSKQHFGFDEYQVKSKKSINRFIQLSFVAASLTQLLFVEANSSKDALSVEEILSTLGIHWYRPGKLTRGLMSAYLQWLIGKEDFSARNAQTQNSPEIDPALDTAA